MAKRLTVGRAVDSSKERPKDEPESVGGSKQDYSQSSLEPAAALLEFNRQYKVFVVGKVPNISKDVAGHALAVVCEATAGDEFRECDVCLTKMINGTESHHCNMCDYDLCRNCAAINAAASSNAMHGTSSAASTSSPALDETGEQLLLPEAAAPS
jgi:hypothetical protein